jgi:dTDP-4-dehydrorhamnose 3,5-epimerase-like enzyme
MLSNTRDTKVGTNLNKLKTINLVTFSDPERGNLTVVQSKQDIPFSIARIFYIYGIPNECERGGHAHREAEQVLIAISGSFSLEVTDARQSKSYAMKEPTFAVYVPPMIWTRVCTFSDDAVCLVLTNTSYDPDDYIRDWDEYVSAIGKLS